MKERERGSEGEGGRGSEGEGGRGREVGRGREKAMVHVAGEKEDKTERKERKAKMRIESEKTYNDYFVLHTTISKVPPKTICFS